MRAADEARAALLERLGERMRVQESRDRLEEAQRTAEGAVELGSSSVRIVHQAIADIPFGALEQVESTRDTARLVRKVHDTTANGVYDAIDLVNSSPGRGCVSGSTARDPPRRVQNEPEDES